MGRGGWRGTGSARSKQGKLLLPLGNGKGKGSVGKLALGQRQGQALLVYKAAEHQEATEHTLLGALGCSFTPANEKNTTTTPPARDLVFFSSQVRRTQGFTPLGGFH